MRAVDAKDSRTCFNISEDIVPIISLKIVRLLLLLERSKAAYDMISNISMLIHHMSKVARYVNLSREM